MAENRLDFKKERQKKLASAGAKAQVRFCAAHIFRPFLTSPSADKSAHSYDSMEETPLPASRGEGIGRPQGGRIVFLEDTNGDVTGSVPAMPQS
jgi:hypothetical protein